MINVTNPEVQDNDNIILENVGPISHAAIPAKPGHITVLRGSNGTGKTHALSAVNAFASGKDKGSVPLRDGAKKGRVEFGGVRLSVQKVNRMKGELDVATIEGKFSIDDLVSPGVKDPEAADAKSIKALIGLLSPEAAASLFFDLFECQEEFESIVSPDSIKGDDLVKMAAAIKRDLEAKARNTAKTAENHRDNQQSKEKSNEGIDLTAEHDSVTLQTRLEECLQRDTELKNQRTNAMKINQNAAEAKTKLAEVEENYSGLTLEESEKDVNQKREAIEQQQRMIEKVERDLRELKSDLNHLEGEREEAEQYLDNVRSYEQSTAGWRDAIEAAVDFVNPSDAILIEADESLAKARVANEQGVRVRDAIKIQAEAEQEKAIADEHQQKADRLRDAAKATADVLSEVIASSESPLKVQIVDGETRLVLKTSRGDTTYYRELSEGERWKIALDIAINALKDVPSEHKIMVIGQAAWQDLDYDNKQLIGELIAKTDISVLTAEAAQTPDEKKLAASVL